MTPTKKGKESPALLKAIEGLNKEKTALTMALIGFNELSKFLAAFDVKKRLREIDKEVKILLNQDTPKVKEKLKENG